MNSTLKSLFSVSIQIFLLVLGITIFTTAFLELIFAPEAIFKYYLPALLMRVKKYNQKVHQEVFSEPMILLYYVISVLVQVTRVLASIALFFTLSTTSATGNNRGWLLYPKISLLSVALSLSLLLHQQINGTNLYRAVILPDMYFSSAEATASDMPKCTTPDNGKTECTFPVSFEWHQAVQCCGWKRAEDWLLKHTDSPQLPLFCCALVTTTLMIDNVFYFKSFAAHPESCQLHSANRFQEPCGDIDASSFEQFHQLNIFAHLPNSLPSSLLYSVLKLGASLLYGLASNHQLFS